MRDRPLWVCVVPITLTTPKRRITLREPTPSVEPLEKGAWAGIQRRSEVRRSSKPALRPTRVSAILRERRSEMGDRYDAWQEPDALAERLVRHGSRAGELVDPLAGTGTFPLAAAKLGRRALGGDISDDNLAIAVSRGCQRAA